jgi:hypothetical protein
VNVLKAYWSDKANLFDFSPCSYALPPAYYPNEYSDSRPWIVMARVPRGLHNSLTAEGQLIGMISAEILPDAASVVVGAIFSSCTFFAGVKFPLGSADSRS